MMRLILWFLAVLLHVPGENVKANGGRSLYQKRLFVAINVVLHNKCKDFDKM